MSKTHSTAPVAFKRSCCLETTLAYMESKMSLIAKGEETAGLLPDYPGFGIEPGTVPIVHGSDR